MAFQCTTCNYQTTTKSNLGIHCKTKRHCMLVGTPWEGTKKVKNDEITKKVYTDVMEGVNNNAELKKFDVMLENNMLMHQIDLLKQQLKHQEEMSLLKHEMTQLLLAEKDKMIDYLTTKEASHVIQVVQPQAPQVASQVAPQVVQPQAVYNEVIPKVSKKQLKEKEKEEKEKEEKEEKEEDDNVLNKKYLVKNCTMSSIGFCKDIEVTDMDYELFKSCDYIPINQVVVQILERSLKRMTLHEMGCVVLPNDKIYTHLEDWTESSKGLHHIRKHIAKELQLYLLEDEIYENKHKLGDDDAIDLPTDNQLELYTSATMLFIQLDTQERHEVDQDIRAIIQKYSTK